MFRLSGYLVYNSSVHLQGMIKTSVNLVESINRLTHKIQYFSQNYAVPKYCERSYSASKHSESESMLDAQETSERDILFKKIVLTVKGHEPEVLKSYETFIMKVCGNLGLTANSETRNRPVFLRLSMNKSPFIYKKHQRQYEFRTYYKYITVDKITGCTADVFLEYIQRNIPEGIAMEVAKHRLEPLPEYLSSTVPATDS